MKGYSASEVARLLGLPVGRIYSYVRSGFLAPERGESGGHRFSFQDVVILRAAKGLEDARISPVRVRKILKRLVTELPEGRTLAGLTISAEGTRVVAREGGETWDPESGQRLLDFEGDPPRTVERIARRQDDETAESWFESGLQLEADAPDEARDAYRRAIELDPLHVDAHVNLGRLLHERGDLAGAEERYRAALAADPDSVTAAFNLGVVLDDLGRTDEAVGVYERIVKLDPGCADAHFNLASLYERTGRTIAALRHKKTYERLTH